MRTARPMAKQVFVKNKKTGSNHIQREKERQRETERQRDRERDRETGRQKDIET